MWPWLALVVLSAPLDEVNRGREVFQARCVMCHGARGDGAGPLAADLPLRPRNFLKERLQWGNSRRSVLETVTNGRSDVMPAFGEALTREELAAVSSYVWSIIPDSLREQPFQPTSSQRVVLVRQRDNRFTPGTLELHVGDSIVFVNDDVTSHELNDERSTRTQKPNQWDRVALATAGTLEFGCATHPSMRLTVKVSP